MSQFVYPVDIISQDTSYYFKEFTTKNHKDFVKVILNENKDALDMFINNLVQELCVGDINVPLLTSIDKLYILLTVRAYGISPEIVLVTETDDEEKLKVSIPVNINDILDAIRSLNLEHGFTVTDGNMTIKGSLPKKMFFDDAFDVICSTVRYIEFNNQEIDLINMSLSEKIHVLNTLPSFVFPKIIETLQAQEAKMKATPIISLDTDKQLVTQKEVFISLFNGTIAEIIKLMFKADLREFYNSEI